MSAVVELSHATIKVGSRAVLKDVSFAIEPGEFIGVLGPNGAGKTTLIGVVCGIVNASAGTVTVDGHDILADYRALRATGQPPSPDAGR